MGSSGKNKSKFKFDEIVIVISKNPKHANIYGKKGIVHGMSGTDEDEFQIVAYAISIIDTNGDFEDCCFLYEEDLESTGEMAPPNIFMTDDVIKVSVDPKTGEGNVNKKDD
jgi:hypothetical protein